MLKKIADKIRGVLEDLEIINPKIDIIREIKEEAKQCQLQLEKCEEYYRNSEFEKKLAIVVKNLNINFDLQTVFISKRGLIKALKISSERFSEIIKEKLPKEIFTEAERLYDEGSAARLIYFFPYNYDDLIIATEGYIFSILISSGYKCTKFRSEFGFVSIYKKAIK